MEGDDQKKAHRASKSGRKADKKSHKNGKGVKDESLDPKIRNPKAFAYNSAIRAERKFRRTQDIETKKERVPTVDRTPVEAPPFVIAIVGPPKVGKSTLFQNLIKNCTRQTLHDVKGPVTIVSGKKRRLTLIECNNDINSMIDIAKVADLVLLLVDASFGFEMEIFEFLNICQVHGFPQIMGVLTHLDLFKNKNQLKKTKKTLKHRFWTEVYPGSKLFYLSGYHPMTNSYPTNEIHNLARFISVMKFRPTLWRSEHAYVIADRMEDITSPDDIRVDPKVDRTVCLYGFVHGTFLKSHVSVHIPGLGDYTPEDVTVLEDPCPLPLKDRIHRRSLNDKEKVIYAPFSGVGGIVYDHDAVYIDLGGSHSHGNPKKFRNDQEEPQEVVTPFVTELRDLKSTLNEKMDSSGLKLFSSSKEMTSADFGNDSTDYQMNGEEEDDDDVPVGDAGDEEETSGISKKSIEIVQAADGRLRRKVIFPTQENSSQKDDADDFTQLLSKEVKLLKKADPRTYEADESDDAATSEDEEHVEVLKKNKSSETKIGVSKPSVESTKIDAAGLAAKLKARLNKANATAVPAVPVEEISASDAKEDDDENTSGSESDQEEESFDEDEEDDEDEGIEEDETSDDGSSDEEEKATGENQGKTYGFGEDPESIEKEKQKRYAEAQEAFYSRFHKRSLQKMIYDDTSDYMNVTARADFDLANCNVQELQAEDEMEEDAVRMKDLFVGGDYAEAAKKLLDDDDTDVEDAFGDFEELDKKPDPDSDPEMKEGDETGNKKPAGITEDRKEKKREAMKRKLKEKFDMEYDDGGEKSFYKDWKSQVEEQTKTNRTFFGNIEDPALLQELQGLAPGSYVRIQLKHLPYEFVVNFDPQRVSPLVIGSLDTPNQETLAVIQARVKKHRWHPKILKTRDPIILSVGWRRFQTVALYSVHDHNMRNRMIKYTPEHLHCVANFFGPVTPQGTGILGIAPQGFDGFRITLTGTILDIDKSTELVKKLKLIGTPSKIFKKSAFIDGMFNSQLEVAKFVGAKLKSVSGVRGVIKRPLRAPPGSFRATFEDKILASDIVFCRTWAKVDIPKFFLSLPTHVIVQPRVIKTLGQLKRERQIKAEPNPDHLYTPIERTTKEFRPLKIPKKLQNRLPYQDKPKVQAKLKEHKRIAVIKEPHERKMTQMLKVMKSRMDEKDSKEKLEKAKKAAERAKIMKKLEEKQTHRQKELRKKVFRTLGQMNKNKDAAGGPGGNSKRKFQKRR